MTDSLCDVGVRVHGYPEVRVRFPALPYSLREVVGLQRDLLSLMSAPEELLERKNSGSGLENQYYGRRGSPRSLCGITLSAKVGTNIADNRSA
jgi:hypothetical protein